mgnify:CR=1 FL=1
MKKFDLDQAIFPRRPSNGQSLANLVKEGYLIKGEFLVSQRDITTKYYLFNRTSGLYEPTNEKEYFDSILKKAKV